MLRDEITAKAIAISCREKRKTLRREEIVSDAMMERSEFFHGFMKPLDYFHTLGSIGPTRDGAHLYVLTINRPQRIGGFTNEEEPSTALLAPYVKRAVDIHLGLQRLRVGEVVHAAAAKACGRAIFLMDSRQRLLWTDAAR